jgi:predicted phosphodiesterase
MITRIQELMHAKPTYTWSWLQDVLADEFPNERTFTSSQALRSWYRRNSVKVSAPLAMPKQFEEVYTLPSARTLVLADLHCPYHDKAYLEAVVAQAEDRLEGIEQIVIAGDLFDFDNLSQYPKDHHSARLDTELELAGSVLIYLTQYAPVCIMMGNHDNRLAKKLDAALSYQRIISAALNGKEPLEEIKVTNRDYIYLGDYFVIGHLSQYSTTPGKIAAQIAKKYKRHALVGHDHLCGAFVEKNENFVGASIGCIADTSSFWYAERRLTTMPMMQQGYALIYGPRDTFSLYNHDHEEYFMRLSEAPNKSYNCFYVQGDA